MPRFPRPPGSGEGHHNFSTSTMGLAAVAEGVETEEQAVKLHDVGYRLAQGFHFARPAPPEDVHRLLLAPAYLPNRRLAALS